MLRKIITPQTQDYTLQIPVEYLNTQIEILVLPFDNKEDDSHIDLSGDSIKKNRRYFSRSNN